MAEQEQKSKCQNCEKVWTEEELRPARFLWERLEAGDIFTSKECPECGALCQPVELIQAAERTERALAALDAIIAWDDGSPEYTTEALDELPGLIEDARQARGEDE